MKSIFLLVCSAAALPLALHAATNISPTNHCAYGANFGWIDWRGDVNSGAVVGQHVCSGFIWSANVGWINLGSGSPANGMQYGNASANDFGLNRDSLGNLRGYAYGANIGWISFESSGAPKVDPATGIFSGSAWSANCGWISLNNASAFVQTDTIANTDSDGDGIPDAWELSYTNTLTAFSATSDADHDGVSDKDEYLADTNPLEPGSALRITAISITVGASTESVMLSWKSRPTRQYMIQSRSGLDPSLIFTNAAGPLNPSAGTTTTTTILFNDVSPRRFFRVEALPPSP